MGMKKNLLATALLLASMQAAQAGTITDNYVGGNDHGYGDVISASGYASTYNITSAVVTRVGSLLTIAITTGFAGKANNSSLTTSGIGYGDLFLSNAWAPNTATANYSSDNLATTGTAWKYAVSLNEADRKSNANSTTTLYKVSNSTTAVNTTKTVMDAAGISGTYRDGQIDTVNKASGSTASIMKTAAGANMTGNLLINDASDLITFTIDIAGTEMMNWDSFAIHWGETCQNDVIEGITSVPEPTGLALFGLGLAGLIVARRRKMI